MRPRLAAVIYLALTAVVVAFQLALAAGAPWGELTMGGAYPGRLPPQMRGVAVASAALLMGMAGVVAYAALGVALNAATPSARERVLWLPVVIALAVCALVGRPLANVALQRTGRFAARRGEPRHQVALMALPRRSGVQHRRRLSE